MRSSYLSQQEYGVVTKALGNGRLECYCFNGETRICHIPGSFRTWIEVGDYLLISIRSFQESKSDVVAKYSPQEVRYLKNLGEIPDISDNADVSEEQEIPFEFDD